MMYKLQKDLKGNVCSVERTDTSGQVWYIPFDPDNTDYQKYLAWLEEGNTPQEADDVTN